MEEIFELSLDEAEVLEKPLEEVSSEVLGWKEHVVVLGIARRGFLIYYCHYVSCCNPTEVDFSVVL